MKSMLIKTRLIAHLLILTFIFSPSSPVQAQPPVVPAAPPAQTPAERVIEAELLKYKDPQLANREVYRENLKGYFSRGPEEFGQLLIISNYFLRLEHRLGPLYERLDR